MTEGFWMANYSVDTIDAALPTKFLRQGTNELVLTATDELPAPSVSESETYHEDLALAPGIYYDALALEQDPQANYAANELTVDAQPTIFYVQKDNVLKELVDVYVRHNSPFGGEVALSIDGTKYNAQLSSRWEFGEQMVEFAIPDFPAGTKGEVTVHLGGRARRLPVELDPARKWNLFLVPNVHLDVGYTDYQAKTAEVQSRILDEAIQLTHDHPDFRYSVDAFWSVRKFLEERSNEQEQLLFQAVKDKRIFVPAAEANLLTGFPALETLIRSMYPAVEFIQRSGGDPNYASITDVPSYSWSYASVLAAAGVKYFAAASNNDRAPILLQGHLHEKSPFWWEGPDGARVLMWYSRHYHQMWFLFTLPPSVAAGRGSLPLFTQIYNRPSYKSNSIILYGTQAENSDLFPQQASFANEWNQTYAYPRLKYSGFAEAMAHIAGQFGDSIPVVRGDGGPYWEDGIASTARSAALERQNEQRALAAEKFSTLSSLVDPRLHPDTTALKALWHNMVMYDEHTWGDWRAEADPYSQQAEQQLGTKEAFANDATRQLDDLLRRNLAAMANTISAPPDTLLVFNPLNWQRSSLVEIDLEKGHALVDLAANRPVSCEVLSSGNDYDHVRFLAQDVPSVGYKAYAIKSTSESPADAPATWEEVIENRYYRVVLDPQSGALKSIFDKELNKELVNPSSPYRFNQYLYVTGGDKQPNTSTRSSPAFPLPDFRIHGADNGRLISVTHQPFGVVARLESQGVNTPKIATEVILFDNEKKIEFINRVQKDLVYAKESVYFAFPFAMEHPRFRYETQNGFVDPSRDQMPGAGKEWFSVQHWAAADEGGVSVALVPIDSSLVCLGDIFRATWPKDFGRRAGTIFSYAMNNYWGTNYAAAQGGEFTFRYVLTSGDQLTPASLSRLGWDEMTPAEIDQITEDDKAINAPQPLPAGQGSLVQVNQPNVVLVTWKMAEDENGTIMRFLETGGQTNTVEVQVPYFNVQAARRTDALERNQSDLATTTHGFSFAVKPFEIVTVRLAGVGNVR